MNKKCIFLFAALFSFAVGCSDDNADDNNDDQCSLQDTRCENGVFQVCTGKWVSMPCTAPLVCTVVNNRAQCAAPDGCAAGAKRCNGDVLEQCTGNAWSALPCSGKCVENNGTFSCVDEAETCTSGSKRCNGDVLEQCTGNAWSALPCSGKCVENNGTFSCVDEAGTCTSGAKRCNGDVLEQCTGNTWSVLPCSGKCVENNGTFSCAEDPVVPTEECVKDQTKCVDDGTQAVLWTCSESGSWIKTPCPASDVEGARLSCRNAGTCSTVICPDGTLFNSETKVCQEHNHSNACTAGRTYCNGKTNFLYECLETGNEAPTTATDCTAEGKVCVKIDDDESVCMAEECSGHFCEGEVLHYCTEDHRIDTELGTMDCTESDRICDINEFGYGECMDPECITENESRCVDGDNTKIKTCINKRWVETSCESGTCSNGSCQ